MQHPESDDWARQANVVSHRSVKELWSGIGAGYFRFMQQRLVATLLARRTCLFSDIPIVIEPRALRDRLGSPWSSMRQTVDRCSRQL